MLPWQVRIYFVQKLPLTPGELNCLTMEQFKLGQKFGYRDLRGNAEIYTTTQDFSLQSGQFNGRQSDDRFIIVFMTSKLFLTKSIHGHTVL